LVWFWHVADRQQIERATMVYEIALTASRGQQRALMLARLVGNVLTARERPDRYSTFVGIPRQVAVIEGNRAMWLKRALCLPVSL
jgi:hypothetical protein